MPSMSQKHLAGSGHTPALALILALFLVAPVTAAEETAPATAAPQPSPPAAKPKLPDDSMDAAFGLRWFDSKAEIESLGVELRQPVSTPFGDSYSTAYLPRNVPDMHYAVLSFGYNDQLIHITAVGGDFENDNEARQAIARYKELREVLQKKYGEGESDSHFEKVFSGSLTALGFQQKKNWMYTVFKQSHMRIELSVISEGVGKMRWRLIFENLDGMAQLERQRRRSEEAAF